MGKGENSKKVSGNARKAAAAEAKQAKVDAEKTSKEDSAWAEGSKDNSKKQAAEAKKREAAAKKAEREAELAAETSAIKTTKLSPKATGKKAAPVSRGIDSVLSSLDAPSSSTAAALNASGIDNALDALSLTSGTSSTIDRHPERRFKAAYAVYEERRIAEGKASGEWTGLRLGQIKDRIGKEFEKSDENPFNQSNNVNFDASREEIASIKEREKQAIENRLTDRS